MNARTWIFLSGLLWAAVGFGLLYKGLHILSQNQNTAAVWIAAGLLIGFVKGRFVLAKTVQRMSKRILALPAPIRFQDVYPLSYWILIASMMALGFLLRWVPLEWRGFIDVAVGSALFNGAMLYFRAARSPVKAKNNA